VRKTSPQVIVITGVTRGLGRALAEGFAELGHTVAGCGRSAGDIEFLRRELGETHDFQVIDVTHDASVREWAGKVFSRFGAPDLLLNNAGLTNHSAALWDVPVEECNEVIDVNIKGTINVVRHFVPAMIERGSGVIVNFSSGLGRSTAALAAPYCATKWAVEGLTRALAQELPRGLAAIPLAPGVVNTDLLRTLFGAGAQRYPTPQTWAKKSIPFLLKLGPRKNGKALKIR
jgi:NAD(P)-dependent dehydrogenase (short-subunit alcohol dehydrogenase family)